MDDKKEGFSYTYSAKQQEEVKRIRQKYLPPEENKLEQLRRLDESATRPGRIAALAVGLTGTLLLDAGMCCATVWTAYFIPGVVIGTAGLAAAGASSPLYSAMTKHQRAKLALQIVQLSQELMAER